MPGIASAATAVVIGHVAAGTKTIRVGAGGVMLPNHSPLIVAEQFGTLATLFPGRIDLGLGRAPGTDPLTARALRRDLLTGADRFPQDVVELQNYFRPAQSEQSVRAVPGSGLNVPIWLLGSSLFSAQLAAQSGVAFCVCIPLRPCGSDGGDLSLSEPIQTFTATASPLRDGRHQRHYGRHGFRGAAPFYLTATSIRQSLAGETPGRLPPPIEDIAAYASPIEITMIDQALSCSAIGSPESVIQGLRQFLIRTQVDELMIITANIYDHAARLKSFATIAKMRDLITANEPSISQ